MLDSVKGAVGSLRRARLFACACCRRVWNLFQVEEIRKIVAFSEAYADGEISATELEAVYDPAVFKLVEDRLYGLLEPRVSIRTGRAMLSVQHLAPTAFNVREASYIATETSLDPATDYFREQDWEGVNAGLPGSKTEHAEQVILLWDIFGNPFRPVTLKPEWLTSSVVAVGDQMYKSRNFSSMHILGDALRDAGCDSEVILNHCRGTNPHVRGCFVVDLILGRAQQ